MVMVESTMMPLGTPAPDFALPDTNGRTVSRDDFAGKPLLVVFLCNHCPFVKHIAPALAKVARECQDKGVAVVGIMPNDVENFPQDAPDKMAEEVRQRGYTFGYLHDASQEVAKAYTAACTPDLFLFDADHKLYYRGQFDATRPDKGAADGSDLTAAVDALLAGQPAPDKQYPAAGCNIKWKPGNEPQYFNTMTG
jgi:peroxiredoxin